MASPKRIAHIVYRTRRFEEMIDWYQQVFEAKVHHQNPVIAFLSYDAEHHRIAFLNLSALDPDGDPHRNQSAPGVDHVAYTFDNLGDLVATYERLKAIGIEPYWPIHHGITISIYYKDPDGNRFEFQVDCFDTQEAGVDYLQSAAFEANPIGVDIDFNDVVSAYHAGVPTTEILRMPSGAQAPLPPGHGIGA
ncbi:MAG: VOC family protein [Pseudomonadota bacterium]